MLPANAASVITDTEIESVLMGLVSPLLDAADIPLSRVRIHVINDDDFNAFVTGGEDIYVYTGLLKQIKNPSAFQAVISHELGHTLGGHMAQMSDRLSAEMTRTMLIQALGVGLMVAGGNPSMGAGVLAGSSGIAQQSMLSFSRDEERIADSLGFDLMVRSGQNPNGFITVFTQMADLTGAMESRVSPHRINHPLTSRRLNDIRTAISELGDDFHPKSDVAPDYVERFELLRAKLVGYLDSQSRIRELYPVSDKTDSALYARAISNMRFGDLETARRGVRTLISRHPQNPYFYELLGDIEYQSGNYNPSVAAYERSLSLLSDTAPQIQTALALVLTARKMPGDAQRAISLAKHSLLLSPAPLTYWVLARAYGDDNHGNYNWAMAEYYNMLGDSESAKRHATIARQHLPPTCPEYIKSSDIISASGKK